MKARASGTPDHLVDSWMTLFFAFGFRTQTEGHLTEALLTPQRLHSEPRELRLHVSKEQVIGQGLSNLFLSDGLMVPRLTAATG